MAAFLLGPVPSHQVLETKGQENLSISNQVERETSALSFTNMRDQALCKGETQNSSEECAGVVRARPAPVLGQCRSSNVAATNSIPSSVARGRLSAQEKGQQDQRLSPTSPKDSISSILSFLSLIHLSTSLLTFRTERPWL